MNEPTLEQLRAPGHTSVRLTPIKMLRGPDKSVEIFYRLSDDTYWWAHCDGMVVQARRVETRKPDGTVEVNYPGVP